MPSLIKGIGDEIVWGALALGTPALLLTYRVIPRGLLRDLPSGIAQSYALLADNSAAVARRVMSLLSSAHLSGGGQGSPQADAMGGDVPAAGPLVGAQGSRRDGASHPRPRDNDKCAVCWEPFDSPCCTSCGHWFCGVCILRVWQYRAAAICMPVICPICRQAVTHLMLAPPPSRGQRRRRQVAAASVGDAAVSPAVGGQDDMWHGGAGEDGARGDDAMTEDGAEGSPPASPRDVVEGGSGTGSSGWVLGTMWQLWGWATGQRATWHEQGAPRGHLTDSVDEYNRIFRDVGVGRGGRGGLTPRQLLAAVPRMLRLLLTTRHLSHLLVQSSHSLMVLGALLYIVSPLDLISEGLTGVIGMVDDLLLILVLFIYLRALYQTSVVAFMRRPSIPVYPRNALINYLN